MMMVLLGVTLGVLHQGRDMGALAAGKSTKAALQSQGATCVLRRSSTLTPFAPAAAVNTLAKETGPGPITNAAFDGTGWLIFVVTQPGRLSKTTLSTTML